MRKVQIRWGYMVLTTIGIILAFTCDPCWMGIGSASGVSEKSGAASKPDITVHDDNQVAIAAPPFSDGIFPCSDCHIDIEVNRERRPLEEHTDILLEHDAKNRWCLDCHDAENRDMLHLADGRLVDFKESHILCGQCHGPKLRDWRAGDHGKRTGEWSGQKQYLLCVHCHNPHSPLFSPIEPLPAPLRPRPAQ